MRAKFIIGRAGAGKTHQVINEIADNIDKGWDKPLLMLVPNQFSLEMEKKLVLKTGGKGMDAAQVLSFERLSYRVFSLYGKPDKKTLDDTGKAALLRKILYSNRERLKYYGGAYAKDGFINALSGMITEFYKYGLNAAKLEELSGSNDFLNTQLALKIYDLSIILNEFSKHIENDYITLEQNIDLLAEALPEALYFHGAKIWLDGFYRFTEQDYRVITELCRICEEMTVSLTMPEAASLSAKPSAYDPFYEPRATAMRLKGIFGCEAGTVRLSRGDAHGYGKAVSHLEKSYFDFSPPVCHDVKDSVFITRASNFYDEADMAAAEISRLVREYGYRYKEIAVCACDLVSYEHVVRDAFNRLNIPYFIDMSRPVFGKRLVETVRALIFACASGRSAESVVRLLRTGLFDFTEAEIDVLENYALEYGIKGYKWDTEWKNGANRYGLEGLNNSRVKLSKITAPFFDLFKNNKKPTVKEASSKIFELLEKNGVQGRLILVEGERGDTVQIWNILVAVFEKLVEILPDERVDIKTFFQIVEGALESAVEGFIPQTADAVILGDIKRTRLSDIKALFVLGLTDGVIPSSKGAEGLLSDADRLLLAEKGAALAPFGVQQSISEQFLVYSALAKPKERLYLSYPELDFDGNPLRISLIAEKIQRIFPEAGKIDAVAALYSKKAFLSEMAVKTGELKNGGDIDGIWQSGLKWLSDNDYSELITDGAFASRRSVRLSDKSIKSSIKNDIYSSITRIEKYIKCPFSYFAEYGLRASERRVYGFNPIDMGNVYHNALDILSKLLGEYGLKWGGLNEENSVAEPLIEKSVEEACEGLDILEDSEKNKYLVTRIKRITKRAVWALDRHVKSGSFVPFEYEAAFGETGGALPPITVEIGDGYRFVFSGRIDRVDVFDKDGGHYIKIIDYKSGARKFDLCEVYYGLQLQLMLYLDAYLKNGRGKKAFPAGVFYFRILDPIIEEPPQSQDNTNGTDNQKVIDEILKQLKMSGLAVNDLDIIDALDNGLAGASSVIPVKLKKPAKKGALPEPDAYSSVATMEQFYLLMKRAENVIRQAGKQLVSGDIEARPVKGVGLSPCVYCGYGQICGFDTNNGYRHRHLKKLKASEIFEMLKGDVSDER